MPRNLCPEIRGCIVKQAQAGKSVAKIAAEIPCSEKTVRRWIRRFADGGDHALHDHRRDNHCPRKTRADEDQAIIAAVADQPFSTVQEITSAANVQISERTVRRRLNEAGYHCYRPAHKIPLLEKMTGRACSVSGCDSGKKVPSHRFPKKKERRIQWFQNLQMTQIQKESEIQKLRVCSKHFRESDYNNIPMKRFLLCTAVPCINVQEENVEHITEDFLQRDSQIKEIENRKETGNDKELQSYDDDLQSCNAIKIEYSSDKSDSINNADIMSLNVEHITEDFLQRDSQIKEIENRKETGNDKELQSYDDDLQSCNALKIEYNSDKSDSINSADIKSLNMLNTSMSRDTTLLTPCNSMNMTDVTTSKDIPEDKDIPDNNINVQENSVHVYCCKEQYNKFKTLVEERLKIMQEQQDKVERRLKKQQNMINTIRRRQSLYLRPELGEITRRNLLSLKARQFYENIVRLKKSKRRLKNKVSHMKKDEKEMKKNKTLLALSMIDNKKRINSTAAVRQQFIDMV